MLVSRLLTVSPLLLLGCAPIETFYKPGVSFAQLEADSVQCEVFALRQVPVANKTVQNPPDFIPPEKICDKDGNCRVIPGEFVPGEIRTVDTNLPLRIRVLRQCMGARGYTFEEIPQCTGASAKAVQVSPLPPLTATSCAVRSTNGQLGIGTQN